MDHSSPKLAPLKASLTSQFFYKKCPLPPLPEPKKENRSRNFMNSSPNTNK
jgi:hypothetical protein